MGLLTNGLETTGTPRCTAVDPLLQRLQAMFALRRLESQERLDGQPQQLFSPAHPAKNGTGDKQRQGIGNVAPCGVGA